MTVARCLAALAAAALALEFAACTLDFDRFEPVDANAGPSPPDASVDADGESAEASPNEATAPSSNAEEAEGATDAMPAPDAPAQETSCASPPSCLDTVQTCGAVCVQQEKQCSSRCQNGICRSNCMRTESSCLATCTSTCMTCVRDSGCGAMSDCADASAGD
jgi:hypothetical protein